MFKRFRDWVKADVFKRRFDALSDDPEMEYAMATATIFKVRRHGQGGKGGLIIRPWAVILRPPKDARRFDTKIGALVDALANLVAFVLDPGLRRDVNLVDNEHQ